VAVDRPDDGDLPQHARGGDDGNLDARTAPHAEHVMLTDPELRAAEARRYHAIVDKTNTSESDSWTAAVPKLRAVWEEHLGRHPEQECIVPGTRTDGSWGTHTDRMLSAGQNAEATRVCAEIRQLGREVILPAIKRIEAADPQRHLAGLEHMLKGEDRLKEKAADVLLVEPDLTAGQALAKIPDAVRFTLRYSQEHYADGVLSDVQQVKGEGFELVKLKNLWEKEHYKGINSQWRHPDTGLRFEIQFHTPESLEAKELTHGAYERLRRPGISQAEREELEAYQKQVNELIATPAGAAEIEEFPRKHG
jgi:hypothetical protein